MKKKPTVNHPREAVRIARNLLLDNHREHFLALYLNSRNQLNKAELVSLGSYNACLVHPACVFRTALVSRSLSIIVLHTHPSGDPDPSEADIELTNRLKKAGDILGVTLADHIVFEPGGKYNSIINK
jgi:DNA repair protein RadC